MALTNIFSQEQMKQYLYGELSEAEAQAIEERLFADEEFFYELNCLENDLIDKYAQGRLNNEELKRFEKSLTKSDERRIQVKNARALHRYIKERKSATTPVIVLENQARPVGSPLFSLFGFQSSVMRYAMVGLLIFLGIAGVWLLYDNSRIRQELARVQNKHIEDARQQIESLQRQINEQKGRNEELLAQMSERDSRLRQLEQELETLRRHNQTLAFIAPPTIRLAGGSRGRAEPELINYDTKSVTVRLQIETEIDYESYQIRENQKTIHENLKALIDSGKKYLDVTLPARTITFSVWGIDRTRGAEKEIATYDLVVKKKK